MKTYLCERRTRPGHALFPNLQGEPLSADAIAQRLRTHVHHAARSRPELADTRITVHTLRHTAAMRFPRRRHRHRGDRPMARPGIHRDHQHLPPCRHGHQTTGPRTDTSTGNRRR
ncbi:hypothetical protein [Rhodococcus sp. DMU1]|uniref:hypothetical protein n=1 Tax=Rhodococcus sp. DMU1 TaxID=2722825 RepID=UPI0032B7BB58